MKTLNRTLSLTLVFALVFSLMSFAFAADTTTTATTGYTDAASITYNEAVDVTTTIGVFQGNDLGAFAPTDKLTREQAAKVICYLTMGKAAADKLSASADPFTDVPAGRWSAGSIAYCAKQGIVAGYGDGKFGPTDTVTGYQFAKMLLVALGYDAVIQGYNGSDWSINVAKDAFANKLFKGNSAFIGASAATREEAALYTLNTLNASTYYYQTKGTNITVNGVTVNTGASSAAKTGNTFKGTYYPTLIRTDSTDALGRDADLWKYNGTKIGTYASGADYTFSAKITATTNAAKLSALGFTGYTLKATTKDKDGNVTDQFNFVSNNAAVVAPTTVAGIADLTGNGKVVEVYVNGDNATQIDKVVVVDSYLAQVSNINATTKTVTLKTVNSTSKTYTVDSSNPNYAALAAMKVKDYVLVTPAADTTSVAAIATPKTVTGTLTNISYATTGAMSAVTVGGNAYGLSQNEQDVSDMSGTTMAAKANVTLYLDSYGYAIYVTNATVADNYIGVVKVSQSVVGNNVVNILTGYAPDGTVVTLNVGTNPASATVGALYSYVPATTAQTTQYNAEYMVAPLGLTTNGSVAKGTYLSAKNNIAVGDPTFVGIDATATTTLPYASTVKFIFVDPTTGVTVKSGVQAAPKTDAAATPKVLTYGLVGTLADGKTQVITTVYCFNSAPSDATGTSILYLASYLGTTYVNGVQYYNYAAMIDGALVAPVTTKTAYVAGTTTGTFYTYAKDATSGVYTLGTYGAKDKVENSTVVNDVVTGIKAGYLLNTVKGTDPTTTSLTDINASGATIVDLTNNGVNSLSDISDAIAAGKGVMVSAVYNNLTGSAKLNTVSYLYVVAVVTPTPAATTTGDTFAWDATTGTYKLTVAAANNTGTLTVSGLPTGVTITSATPDAETYAKASYADGKITVTGVADGKAIITVATNAGIKCAIPVTVDVK